MAIRRRKSGQKRIEKHFLRFRRKVSKAGDNSVEHIQENLVERIDNARKVRLLILEWMLLVTAIIALAVTQTFWYRESYAVESFTGGGTYTEATLGKVNSLNPLFATTSSEKSLSRLMFGTLTATDYSGHTSPSLAESVTADETGKVWTVKLRSNLKWSDGEPITNKDIIYTVHTIQDPKVNTAYSSSLSGVKLEESDGNLIFKLPTAYASFATSLTFPILPEHILKDVPSDKLLENAFSTSPVTSGAFTYNASQAVGTEGEKVVYMNANPANYQGKPLLDSFAIHAYLSANDIKTAMQSGAVTATAELDATDDDDISSNSIIKKQAALNSGVYAFINTTSPLMNNVNLRRAIQKGIDLKSLRAPLGDEMPLDYPILDTQISGLSYPALPEYDPNSAKQMISEAGLSEGAELNLVTVNTGYLPTLADNLELQLTGLGFKVNKRIAEPGQDFLINVVRPRSYDILIYEIDLGANPDLFPYYHSSQSGGSGLNLSNYNNKLLDALILGARGSMNPEIRTTRYDTFLKYWVEDVPAIGIYQVDMTYFYNKNVRTFPDDYRLVSATDRFNGVESWAAVRAIKNRTP
ncbi:hypothetical protein IKG54_01795 [Candidatus Saccharibacteria bacterium]|nr:hypothetical protein [Candidatus Saccharibacteria bacterium]